MPMAAITITLEIVSLIAAGVSIGLAFFAIGLSLFFFFMSHKSASQMENSVDVQRELFDRMYSDTFSLNRDMVRDLQNRNLQSADDINTEIAGRVAEQTETLKGEYEDRVSELLSRLETSEENVASFRAAARQIIDSAVEESQQIAAEVRTETLRSAILDLFAPREGAIMMVITRTVFGHHFANSPWGASLAFVELEKMIADGLIEATVSGLNTLTTLGNQMVQQRRSRSE